MLTVKENLFYKVNVNMKQQKEFSVKNIEFLCGLKKPNPSVV